jgi:hypothetical protein
MEGWHYGLENTKGVNNILAVLSANQVIHRIGCVYGPCMRLKSISAFYDMRTSRASTENATGH